MRSMTITSWVSVAQSHRMNTRCVLRCRSRSILHRVRTAVQWRDLPERFGPWKTVYERHRL
ncbi:transposase [Streptomyces sp. NPDC088748]|uniref:transposase n=1 Tax=Streptomyces sp. NPDC088748 TaxID=3365887 RepID=UPI0038285BEC